jgi:uncharacterized SAM-binding protein YcdF (DUF218 family)
MPSSQAPRLNRPVKTLPLDTSDDRKTRRTNALCGAMLAFFAGMIFRSMGLLELVPALRSIQQLADLFFVLFGLLAGVRYLKIVMAFAGAAAILLMVVVFTPLSKKMAAPLKVQAPAAEIERGADAVMVLGSWVQGDGTFTGPAASRLLRGMELVRQGRAPVLVVSEIELPAGSYVKAARRLSSELKFPLNVQALPGYVTNTRDEAVHFAALAKSKGWTRVLLVTSPTHTRRATLMFRRAAQGQKLQVLPVASMEFDADLNTLDDPEDRVRVFKWCLREMIGIWVYKRRGWI